MRMEAWFVCNVAKNLETVRGEVEAEVAEVCIDEERLACIERTFACQLEVE